MERTREAQRRARHERIRKRLLGTGERPRLMVFRSQRHLYAQAIDDLCGKTLFSFSTNCGKFRKAIPKGATVEAARRLGEMFGAEMKAKKIQRIVFDRAGYRYHGRVKALAEALRGSGIEF